MWQKHYKIRYVQKRILEIVYILFTWKKKKLGIFSFSPPAHPNVKVFISHCGMLGTQEALYAGTPMLGLPIFGDQPKNAEVF